MIARALRMSCGTQPVVLWGEVVPGGWRGCSALIRLGGKLRPAPLNVLVPPALLLTVILDGSNGVQTSPAYE